MFYHLCTINRYLPIFGLYRFVMINDRTIRDLSLVLVDNVNNHRNHTNNYPENFHCFSSQ
ncbi:hypothetical protein C9154_10580 [Escherichia coli]|nr:hypothetical protein [Escherichia coli]EFN6763410.1 hypothetical protein [Escherichia coli O45:H11]EFO1267312.1 hypothetical protein [Escherichia albertii]EHW66579.1 hypothetical protein ECDEC10B_3833 [Escherichia coli DEC10B]EIJ04610.1 hypothetical protein ECB41_2709 [Escherichia coli B41]